MAKKKTKKKKAPAVKARAKKVAKKKTAKRKRTVKKVSPPPVAIVGRFGGGVTKLEAEMILDRKIIEIAKDVPEIPCTGKTRLRTGEEFTFTIYADVMKVLVPILIKHDLVWRPYCDDQIQSKAAMIGGWYFVHTHYTLRDASTGYGIVVPGFGLGENEFWAADSAGTLALKHSLLQTLMIWWDNRSAIEAMVSRMKHEVGDFIGNIISEAMKGDDKSTIAQLRQFDWFNERKDKK